MIMKKHSFPSIGIGMPVYNGERYLSDAINSILEQTFTDFELIISDNASTDDTPNICRKFELQDKRIRYYRNEVNRGAAYNFNKAFKLSKGKYFKWATHDDLIHPQFLEQCVDVLERLPNVVLCFTGTIFVDEHGREISNYKYPFDLESRNRKKLFLNYARGSHIVQEIFGVIRYEILRNTQLIGNYLGSDLILLGKLSLCGEFYQIQQCLFKHREHKQRSMINPQGAKNMTQWFDSSKTGHFVMPHWRRFYENGKTVFYHPMRFADKVECWIELIRAFHWRRSTYFMEVLQGIKRLQKTLN